MDKQISSDISEGIKNLLKEVCDIEEGHDGFNRIYKSVLTRIKKCNTMYFLNKKEVDQSIAGMAEKFNFHGFFQQAGALQRVYDNYVKNDLPKPELMNRLNVVKLLLCLSETPTAKFLENPEEFQVNNEVEEEEIDWKEYLNEGIEQWQPNYDETTTEDDESDDGCAYNDVTDAGGSTSSVDLLKPIRIESQEKNVIVDFRANREELLNTIQHTWYNQDTSREIPPSKHKEANIEILWEKCLDKESMGLVTLPKVSIISEYKVIREILWQLWVPHVSTVFEFDINNIQVKKNITVSSVTLFSFQSFIQNEFIPYIDMMEFFREFSKSLEIFTYELINSVPTTYKYYNNSLKNIIDPIYRKLSELEDKVREQETIYTLLNLTSDLGEILQPVCQLRKIHREVVIDHKNDTNLVCASTLLSRLHKSLLNAESKLDHDLKLTLFLESIHYYLSVIDTWFTKNDFTDFSDEFPIKKKNDSSSTSEDASFSDSDIWKLNFDLRDGLSNEGASDGIINIIKSTVLGIGRNLHLLRLLGNFTLLDETKETIHQQFVNRVLTRLCQFFKKDPCEFIMQDEGKPVEEEVDLQYKYPLIWSENSDKPIELDKIDCHVDTSDGLLMYAFEDYLFDKPEKVETVKPSLYERISQICDTFFPVLDFFEVILSDILRERFTISGLLVKNMLIEQYHLEKQFQLLRHLFMFQDDLIFPFYRRLFEKMNSRNQNWGNDVWLTASLQDILLDVYPDFYEKCIVRVKDNWRLCPDSLETCDMVSLQYTVNWPLDIIITSAQMAVYKDIFQFILKIKWGLYTLTHLYFTDLEPKMKNYHKIKPKTHRITISKLKYLKFVLVNLLSNIQHYIFSFVFTKYLQIFETDFEKAYDLSTIISSHSEFINNIRLMTMDIRSSEEGESPFDTILKCVNMLRQLWNNIEHATPDRLSNCQKAYDMSYKAINPILFPVFIIDY